MLATYKTKEFPKDGRLWRIFAFGEIDVNDNVTGERTIEVIIAPYNHPVLLLKNYNRNCEYNLAETRSVRIGAGQITALSIGSFLKDGRIVRPPAYTSKSFEFHVNDDLTRIIRADSTFKIGKNDEDYPYIPQNFYHTPTEAQGAKYLVYRLLEKQDGGEIKLIIPCFEILRYYFGTSSRLINQIINGDEIYNSNPQMTYIDTDNTAYLRLRMKTLDSDALTVARIALYKGVADDVINIFSSMMVSRIEGQGAFPVVRFPFCGETKLEVQGKWIKSGELWFFLVYFIEGCSGAFPFGKLRFDRDNDADSDGVDDPNRNACTLSFINTRNQSRKFGKSEEREMTSDEEPSSYKTPAEFNLFSRVFSNAPTDIKKIKKDQCVYRSAIYIRSKKNKFEENVGTATGSYIKSETRPAIIRDVDEIVRKKRQHAPVSLASFLKVLEEICRLHPDNASHSFIPLNVPFNAGNGGISFFPVFHEGRGEAKRKIAWSLIKGKEARVRSVAVVKMTWREQEFYLFEAERRPAKSDATEEAICTLIVFRRNGFVENFVLREILSHGAVNRGVWLNDWQWGDLVRQKYSHVWTVESFAKKLVDYFEQSVVDLRETGKSAITLSDDKREAQNSRAA